MAGRGPSRRAVVLVAVVLVKCPGTPCVCVRDASELTGLIFQPVVSLPPCPVNFCCFPLLVTELATSI